MYHVYISSYNRKHGNRERGNRRCFRRAECLPPPDSAFPVSAFPWFPVSGFRVSGFRVSVVSVFPVSGFRVSRFPFPCFRFPVSAVSVFPVSAFPCFRFPSFRFPRFPSFRFPCFRVSRRRENPAPPDSVGQFPSHADSAEPSFRASESRSQVSVLPSHGNLFPCFRVTETGRVSGHGNRPMAAASVSLSGPLHRDNCAAKLQIYII